MSTIIRNWVNMNQNSSPHVYISTHFYEMFHKAEYLFKERQHDIEYLTFDYMFDDESYEKCDTKLNDKRLIFLYKLKKGLTK